MRLFSYDIIQINCYWSSQFWKFCKFKLYLEWWKLSHILQMNILAESVVHQQILLQNSLLITGRGNVWHMVWQSWYSFVSICTISERFWLDCLQICVPDLQQTCRRQPTINTAGKGDNLDTNLFQCSKEKSKPRFRVLGMANSALRYWRVEKIFTLSSWWYYNKRICKRQSYENS